MTATLYPSFYAVVHRAWNEALQRPNGPTHRCNGSTENFVPDEHLCFVLAGPLRVELHAAGIRLSIDGNGSASYAAALKYARLSGVGLLSEDALRRAVGLAEQPVGSMYSDEPAVPQRASDGLLRRFWRWATAVDAP